MAPRKIEQTLAKEVTRVKVTAKKNGWVHKGEAIAVGREVEVTQRQAEVLKEKGIIE